MLALDEGFRGVACDRSETPVRLGNVGLGKVGWDWLRWGCETTVEANARHLVEVIAVQQRSQLLVPDNP